MKTIIPGVVLLLTFAFAPAAVAQYSCVDCKEDSCSYTQPDGTIIVTIVAQCQYNSPCETTKCVSDCRDVDNCGGCMGWSCYEWDTSSETLVQSETEVLRSVHPVRGDAPVQALLP